MVADPINNAEYTFDLIHYSDLGDITEMSISGKYFLSMNISEQ